MFDDLSQNTNESNIDDTYPNSCTETPEEQEKERPVYLYLKQQQQQQQQQKQKKKPVSKNWKKHKDIPDERKKMKLQIIKNFNNQLLAK